MSSQKWLFSEKSALALADFKNACKNNEEIQNKWYNLLENEQNSINMENVEAKMATVTAAESEEQEKSVELVEDFVLGDVCEATIGEIRARTEASDNFLIFLSKSVSREDLNILTEFVCRLVGKDDAFFEKYCSFVLYQCFKRDSHSRVLENCMISAFAHNRRTVVDKVIIPLLKLDNCCVVLNDFICSMNIDDSLEMINNLLNYSVFDELKEWHIPLLISLYKPLKFNDILQNRIVNIFNMNSAVFSNDKNFGKLLLSVIQKDSGEDRHVLEVLKHVSSMHQTAFRKAALSSIEKHLNQ